MISQLDYVLASSRWVQNAEKATSVQRSDFLSDHRPVVVRTKPRYELPRTARQNRYNVQRLITDGVTKKAYREDASNKLFPRNRHRAGLPVTATYFTRAVS